MATIKKTDGGIEYLFGLLKEKARTVTRAAFWKIPHKNSGGISEIEYGFTDTAKDSGTARFIRITDIDEGGELINTDKKYVDLTEESKKYLLNKGDILVARTGATFGKTLLFNGDEKSIFASYLIRIQLHIDTILPTYYEVFSRSIGYWGQANSLVTGGGQPQFNGNALKKIQVPLPPLAIQKQIVKKIESERALVEGAKKLIEVYEGRMKETVGRVWGDGTAISQKKHE
ncbi:restriction endonuclease subunit S [Candidatus Peregrinibacteria bacterium]|nr:restriction endonuclease subunit S [Candidatus Peregrinibacteria bacterium]